MAKLLSGEIMNSETFLSRLQLFISQAASALIFLLLPLVLSPCPENTVKTATIRTIWEQSGAVLPTLTIYALLFADHGWIRIAVFLLLMVAGIMVERLVSNKKHTGVYHSICLAVFIAVGFLFLSACLLPFMPL